MLDFQNRQYFFINQRCDTLKFTYYFPKQGQRNKRVQSHVDTLQKKISSTIACDTFDKGKLLCTFSFTLKGTSFGTPSK